MRFFLAAYFGVKAIGRRHQFVTGPFPGCCLSPAHPMNQLDNQQNVAYIYLTMFEMIKGQLVTVAEKLVHLRRFL